MRRTVLRGVAWVGGVTFMVRAVRYVALLILGGLLSPRDFGLFAAIHVVVDGLALLQGFGIGHALIYRKEETDEAADTSFFLSAGIGAALVTLAWIAAPAVVRFYGEPGLEPLFRAAVLVLAIQSIRMVPFRLIEKALDFRKKLLPATAGAIAYLAVALTLAYRGAGAWALVWGEIASVLSETVAYWLVSPWRPRLRFRADLARQDLGFGWIVLGGGVLTFAFRNVDRITLSRMFGPHGLGLYAFAFAVANLPATFFVRVLNTVLFPSYSSLGDDRERQRYLFLRATSYTAAGAILYAVGLIAFGRHFLTAMYGDKWSGAVVPLYALAVFAISRSLSALVGDLLVGTGHPNTFRALNALQLAAAAAGVYVGARLGGVPGVAAVMAGASLVALVAGWAAARRVLGATAAGLARSLRGPVLAAAVATVPAVALRRLLPAEAGVALVLASGAAVAATFVAAWFAVDRELRSDWTSIRTRRAGVPGAGGKEGGS
jgi:O-antigen/teichoic acid export membrane protein